ncbi:hypothetical protein BOO71_0015070 [Deinococcus marmoris]|uniref:Quercetin 2,3-dioxygenase C-terminal cupin domain-containing protein n=1 Tax=Deinococcus marmoris TaxID=249408 RepID=A0A1U7NR44_9DEIO|nr:hypothetical protein BOO71_0015070 [Deinococcus marmoris]
MSADPSRRIELEGVGPAERPIDLGLELTGFQTLGYRMYQFRAGQEIDGEAEGDEVLILILSGQVQMRVDEGEIWTLGDGPAAFDAPPAAVYLPPNHHYRITTLQDAQVGYVRSPAHGKYPPRLLRPEDNGTEATAGQHQRSVLGAGHSERLRCSQILLEAGIELRLDSAGERIVHFHLSGDSRAHWVHDGSMQTLKDGDALMACDEDLNLGVETGQAAALSFWTQPLQPGQP